MRKRYTIFSNPKKIYREMIRDIRKAKRFVYLETYIYSRDKVGKEFREILTKKAKEGVKVKLLLDGWGSSADKRFFRRLIASGGEDRYFREMRYFTRMFKKNHERNHRKLLLIDGQVSYIGSMNITASCLEWRELVLRIGGRMAYAFRKSFLHSWNNYGAFGAKRLNTIIHKGFEILLDVPAHPRRDTHKKYVELLNRARKEISIVTPYFVPSQSVIRALSDAVRRGVKVTLIIPKRSDVRTADVLRDVYLGKLFLSGVNIKCFYPRNLHSKLLIVDNAFFLLGSSNVDYRSFLHQYELNLFGTDETVIDLLERYFENTLKFSEGFNYAGWKNRSRITKILEHLLKKVKRYF